MKFSRAFTGGLKHVKAPEQTGYEGPAKGSQQHNPSLQRGGQRLQLSHEVARRHHHGSPLRAGEALVLLPHAPALWFGQELLCPARFYLQPTGCRSSSCRGWHGSSLQAHGGALPAPQSPPAPGSRLPPGPHRCAPCYRVKQPLASAPSHTASGMPALVQSTQCRLHIPAAFTATSFHPLASEGYKQSQSWPQI